jgi:hypothetical protein
MRTLLLLPLVAAAAPPPLPWPFSFDTLSVFAFPGAAPRFMTMEEVSYFTSNFSSILIWGLNATCVNATGDGALFPATCPLGNSHCTCPGRLEDQVFLPTMEASLQAQGQALKAAAQAQGKAYYPVLGYIEGLSAQKYYLYQNALMEPTNSSLLLSTEGLGLIDCYRDGCNWQGVEYRQYDLRQQAARDYYTNEVILGLIAGDGLDGTFIDVIDWWASACGTWKCTPQEAADLVNASLVALEQALAASHGAGKVLSVSSHTSLHSNSEYYLAYCALLAKYGSIRFWEFFASTEEDLTSLMYETQVLGLPTHVHVTARTLAPDWVELAVFLLGMGEGSYFSYSGPWNLNSFDIYPEYARPLGQPLGPARNTTTPVPVAAWQPIPGQNLAYGLPSCPTCPIPGMLAAFGPVATAEACLAAVRANASCTAMTWVPADGTEWARSCWGRLDTFDVETCVNGEVESAPCYASAEAGHVSAVAQPFTLQVPVWTRSFEHVNVTWAPTGGNATLEWF